ncbi:hypothetical protein LOK49_LG06G00333 [Camellia lanceoleosa]|uniref:Uncharacterized protein n=1 Tax=Camellia lanceoleosa TaxID=1840588 RepID=A0ACC0HJ19_9ERIC|nr:hypothetical protein LOK49_LG06G00333 [Camellia lanceoleosa]
MSKRSNSKDSLHGALVTPVISRSIDTKPASLTKRRRSLSANSKFDFVTFFGAKHEDEDVEEQSERVNEEVVVEARVRVSESALTSHCFFILCCS